MNQGSEMKKPTLIQMIEIKGTVSERSCHGGRSSIRNCRSAENNFR